MSLDRDIAFLSRIPLFAGLETEQLRLLAFSAGHLELAPGQVLFREGALADSAYVVAFGGVEISVMQGQKRQVLTSCEAGSLIGETALFVETRRPVTATAIASCELVEIDRKLMTRMLNEYPHVAVRLRSKLVGRLAATVGELDKVQDKLAEISRPPAPGSESS